MASGAGNPRVGSLGSWIAKRREALGDSRCLPYGGEAFAVSRLCRKLIKRIASCANIRLAFNVRDARIDYEENVAFAMFDQRQS